MGVMESKDHFDVIGIPAAGDQLIEFYLRLCGMLTELPAAPAAVAVRSAAPAARAAPATAAASATIAPVSAPAPVV